MAGILDILFQEAEVIPALVSEPYASAFRKILEVSEPYRETLDRLGERGVKDLLGRWIAAPLGARLAFIQGAGWDELAADALADAAGLDLDTAERAEDRRKLGEWLLALGQVGAGLLLTLLLA